MLQLVARPFRSNIQSRASCSSWCNPAGRRSESHPSTPRISRLQIAPTRHSAVVYPVGVNRAVRLVAIVVLLLALLPIQASPAQRVLVVAFDSVIAPITVEVLEKAIREAERQNAGLILIRIDTPGGLLDATREVVSKMLASPVPIVTYVAPSGARAASAGFFILQAGDVAAMAPGTNTGAATPVASGQQMDETMRKKLQSDTAAWLRSIVSQRGRNAPLAEKTVLEARSFTETEALENKLIELIAKNQQELLAQLDGREVRRFDGSAATLQTAHAEVIEYQPKVRERILTAISDPNIAFLLLILGALGIYIEFSSPGLIFPGVAGGILLVLGLFALSVLPINWLGVTLIVLALALFALEAVYTSHGILAAGGATAMILGALLLIEGPPEIRIRLITAVAVALPFSLITVFLLSLAMRAHRRKVMTGGRGMIDEIGEARTALTPEGKVFVKGEYWDAISSTPVEPGAQVRVVGIEGLRLRVEPVS